MILPENVNNLITRLESFGFSAYAVGGCVRDSLMGKTPKDWDICTDASPDEMKKVFENYRIIETGIKHGTVTVLLDEPYEITTFRVDGEYADCRRPERVSFTKNITEDLARRDFTVNAIAYNPKTGIVDPFGGQEDIKRKVLRTVGKAENRFSEDALRIMRGVRFCAVLDFEAEEETKQAMIRLAPLLKNISAERISSELVRALTEGKIFNAFTVFRNIIGEIIPEMADCFDFEQKNIHHSYDIYSHILHAVDNYEGTDKYIKLALFMHDIGKPHCYKFYDNSGHFKGHSVEGAKIAENVIKRLKMSSETVKRVSALVRFHDVRLTDGMPQMLKLMKLMGDEDTARVFEIMWADTLAQSMYRREKKLELLENGRKNFELAIENNLCRKISMLKLHGDDVKKMGFKGKRIRWALNIALNGVMNGKTENNKEALRSYIDKLPRV